MPSLHFLLFPVENHTKPTGFSGFYCWKAILCVTVSVSPSGTFNVQQVSPVLSLKILH